MITSIQLAIGKTSYSASRLSNKKEEVVVVVIEHFLRSVELEDIDSCIKIKTLYVYLGGSLLG